MKYQVLDSKVSEYGHDILISILPEHAKKLYAGTKLFELRKIVPKVIPRRIFLYETGGVSAVTGHIVVERIVTGSPNDVWKVVGRKGATKERFMRYFEDRRLANAFEISYTFEYANPISIQKLRSVNAGFRVPQNFLYLENLPTIHDFLKSILRKELVPFKYESLTFNNISDCNKSIFLSEVDQHIGASYLETSREYGEKLLEIHENGSDVEGVVTASKLVLEIKQNKDLTGFLVLTEKCCGSLKTGPVIILEKFRDKGIGKKLRSAIHNYAATIGFRKVYCTTPLHNMPAVSYLLSSDYRIEGHLASHYHDEHDELVFGYTLTKYRDPSPSFVRQITPCDVFQRVNKNDATVVEFVNDNIASLLCKMAKEWGANQVREAAEYIKGKGSSFKPRAIYVAKNFDVEMVAICIFKRGGSVKILFLTSSAHENSMTKFIEYVEKSLLDSKKVKVRKLYSNIPLFDSNVIQSFYNCNYKVEGVLERPYSNHSDMLVLGKMV